MPLRLRPADRHRGAIVADRILLQGMRFFAFHGNNPEERELGQPFVVDLEIEADLSVAGTSDSLDDTINYAALYRAVKGVMEGPPRNLLEAVAQEIADAVLGSFAVDGVRVRVRKTQPPIRDARLGSAGVEIERRRD